MTGQGQPVEFMLTPGSCADVRALHLLNLDLPAGAQLLGARASTDYQAQEWLLETANIT